MTLQYSRLLSPNTPVEVCTIVGKYERFIDVTWYRPTAGQTLRVTNAKTQYLNVLKSCAGGGPRVEMRRQFVDLDADHQNLYQAPRIYQLSPAKCRVHAYLKACSLTSNTVCFIDDSIEKLAINYLTWIENCTDVAEDPVKPAACIILCGSRLDKGKGELADEFLTSCTSTGYRAATYALRYRCFSHADMFYLSTLRDQTYHRRVNWLLLDRVQQHALDIGNSHLSSLGYYWREQVVHQLWSSSLRFFSQYMDGRLFSIARALSNDVSGVCPTALHQTAFFSSEQLSYRSFEMSQAAISLLGMYMAYHLLGHCPLLDVENFKVAPGSNESLFGSLFRQRYEHVAGQVSGCIIASQPTAFVEDVKAQMHKAINTYLGAKESITQSHLSSLGKYRTFFTQQDPHRLCTGCYFAYWDDVLPCRHGFCKTCTHNYSTQWRMSSRIQMAHCPACLTRFPRPYGIKLQPPTAGGRILSLDGGGIKGIIELEILQQLGSMVGGGLSIESLFDMAMGTSIGGIITLGIFINRWDLNTCKGKLDTLATQVFSSRSSAKGSLGNIFRYLKYAAYIALQQSLVSSDLIQSVHGREFGNRGSMMFGEHGNEAPLKVAVTTCSTRDAACSIVTSYNRPLHQPRPYKWLQGKDAHLHVKVWEAAQCTSAVPFLFPAAQLQGERYHDGALACNNPTGLAIEEAKLFWGPVDTRSLVLSIGCGTTRDRYNDRKGPLSSCAHSFLESMSAAKQNSELLLQGYRFTRLDPFLDIDAVSLDDFGAIPMLQQRFSSMLLHDTAFTELLHSAAFQLLSSIFYFEIVAPPVFRYKSSEYSIMGIVRPRLPANQLQHLYTHKIFTPLYLLVNGKLVTFSMPKKINVRVQDLNTPIEILVTSNTYRSHISGSPMSVEEILLAQQNFYRRAGSRKRRIPRPSST